MYGTAVKRFLLEQKRRRFHKKGADEWSPTGKARGTVFYPLLIHFVNQSAGGYPPTDYQRLCPSANISPKQKLFRIHPRAKPVVFCEGG